MPIKKPITDEDVFTTKLESFKNEMTVQFNSLEKQIEGLTKQLEKSETVIAELGRILFKVSLNEKEHILKCPNIDTIRRIQMDCGKYPSAESVEKLIEKINDTESIKRYYKVFVLAFLATVIGAFFMAQSFLGNYKVMENTVKVNTGIIRDLEKREAIKDYQEQQRVIKDMNR